MRRLLRGGLCVLVCGCATMSTQQEVQLGQQESADISKQLPIIQDADVNRYVNMLGDSIAKLSDTRNLEWHFFVVNSKEVNAFAVPGGYIYVNRGLIEDADKMDELAGVLGHEIGHVIHRHTVKLMQKEQGANVGLAVGCILTSVCKDPATGAAINVAGAAVFAKFSREDEQQADESAVTYVTRAGIDPHGLPDMFQKMLSQQQSNPSAVEQWFSDHPSDQSRIADTQRLIDKIDPAILKGLTQDNQAFHDFQDRVKGLPRS
jgi:predicted Zn-dependent protease